jgi:hypothetical protein
MYGGGRCDQIAEQNPSRHKDKKKKKKQNSWSSSAEDVDTWKRGLNVETYACF